MVDRFRKLFLEGQAPQKPTQIPGLARAKSKLYTQDKAGTVRRSAALPGRNDPCPCESGKKYKLCCGKPRQVTRTAPQPKRKSAETPAEPLQPFRGDPKLVGLPMYDVFLQLRTVFKDDPEHLYAYVATGRVISPSSRQACDDDELQAYDAALKRWSEMTPEQHDAERAKWARYAQNATTWPHAPGPESIPAKETNDECAKPVSSAAAGDPAETGAAGESVPGPAI